MPDPMTPPETVYRPVPLRRRDVRLLHRLLDAVLCGSRPRSGDGDVVAALGWPSEDALALRDYLRSVEAGLRETETRVSRPGASDPI